MKRPRAALKVAAVACSVVLAAGFVSCRAGAFDWVRGTPPAPAENPPEPAATVTPESETFISGSKSIIFIVPPANPTPSGGSAPVTPAPPPTFIGGSKSIAPLFPPSPPAQPDGKSPPAQSAGPPK